MIHNKPINYAPAAPDSLHYASLRSSCRLLGRCVNNKTMKLQYQYIVFFLISLFLISTTAYANPLVLSDSDIAVLPQYLWTGAFVILTLEALSVAIILSLKITKFIRCFISLVIINFIAFGLFSKWLIIVGRYDFDLNMGAFLAEAAIVLIEGYCIYFILKTKWFLKNAENRSSLILSILLSFFSNSISAISGVIYSFWAYHHLYSLGMDF